MFNLIFGPKIEESFTKSLLYVLVMGLFIFAFSAFLYVFTVGLPVIASKLFVIPEWKKNGRPE